MDALAKGKGFSCPGHTALARTNERKDEPNRRTGQMITVTPGGAGRITRFTEDAGPEA
jgi:hypothetical protein